MGRMKFSKELEIEACEKYHNGGCNFTFFVFSL